MVKGIKQMYFWETPEIKVKSCILKDLVIVYSNVGKKESRNFTVFHLYIYHKLQETELILTR